MDFVQHFTNHAGMIEMFRERISVVFIVLLILVAALATACGTIATEPEALITSTQPVTEGGQEVAQAATNTQVPQPTATTPPTETPEPTVEVTEEVATEEVTEEPAGDTASGPTPTPDQFTILAGFGDVARGETLFFESLDTSAGPFSCYTCHNVENDQTKIGPGQYNLRDRAAERIEGQSASHYIYQSIVAPQEYIVPGFESAPVPMPDNYDELLSDSQIYDLIAYMMTLHD